MVYYTSLSVPSGGTYGPLLVYTFNVPSFLKGNTSPVVLKSLLTALKKKSPSFCNYVELFHLIFLSFLKLNKWFCFNFKIFPLPVAATVIIFRAGDWSQGSIHGWQILFYWATLHPKLWPFPQLLFKEPILVLLFFYWPRTYKRSSSLCCAIAWNLVISFCGFDQQNHKTHFGADGWVQLVSLIKYQTHLKGP